MCLPVIYRTGHLQTNKKSVRQVAGSVETHTHTLPRTWTLTHGCGMSSQAKITHTHTDNPHRAHAAGREQSFLRLAV